MWSIRVDFSLGSDGELVQYLGRSLTCMASRQTSSKSRWAWFYRCCQITSQVLAAIRLSTAHFEGCCSKEEAVLRIQDQGIGIPKSEQHRLFEPFYRASNVGTIKGSGLGLAIMHSAVVLHNGRIELESGEGKGTTFTVWLPLTPPEETGYGDNTGN
jgi:signal transduction histidine kinase